MKAFLAAILFLLSNITFAEDPLPELEIKKIEEGVYLYTAYEKIEGWGLVGSNGLVVLDNKDAYLIDTPISATDTEKLVKWIDAQGFTAKASISTHFHTFPQRQYWRYCISQFKIHSNLCLQAN